jgi:hypothetical protein
MELDEPPSIDEYCKAMLRRSIILIGIFIAVLMLYLLMIKPSESEARTPLTRMFLKPIVRVYEEPEIVVSSGNTLTPMSQAPPKDKISNAILIEQIIYCESRGNHDIWGDLDYEYPAYGILQYQERTFNWLKELAGMEYLNWKEEQDQIILTDWAIDNGYAKLWSCYQKVH